jgi:hypothetical protein
MKIIQSLLIGVLMELWIVINMILFWSLRSLK